MRPVQLADIETAARVLLALPARRRADIFAQMLQETALADAHRAATKAAHPRYGIGSIMSACAQYDRVPRPSHIDAEYLDCLTVIICALDRQATL